MKVRIKFSKQGAMKFIGHLDTMRYFQKAIRRADIPVAYSEGFSPHMIMSFAAPLGVGITSSGEYFDMELSRDMPTADIVSRLDGVMVEGMHVLNACRVEDGKASKAMSLVAAADYMVRFRPGQEFCENWQRQLPEFYNQREIIVHKKTKRGERDVDIKPFIYYLCAKEDGIFLQLASASSNYTKPEQVMTGFAAYVGARHDALAYTVERLEIYADTGTQPEHHFVTLASLGEQM